MWADCDGRQRVVHAVVGSRLRCVGANLHCLSSAALANRHMPHPPSCAPPPDRLCQAITAAGSGCQAALAAERYLSANGLAQEFSQAVTEEVGVLQAGCCSAGWLGGSAATAAALDHALVCTKPCWHLAVLDPASMLFALPPALAQKYGATPETQAASSSGADTEATFDPNADKHKVGAGSPLLFACPLLGWRQHGRTNQRDTLSDQHALPDHPSRRTPPLSSTPLAPLLSAPAGPVRAAQAVPREQPPADCAVHWCAWGGLWVLGRAGLGGVQAGLSM